MMKPWKPPFRVCVYELFSAPDGLHFAWVTFSPRKSNPVDRSEKVFRIIRDLLLRFCVGPSVKKRAYYY